MWKTKDKLIMSTMLGILVCSMSMAIYIMLVNSSRPADRSIYHMLSDYFCAGNKSHAALVRNVSFQFCRQLCDHSSCACFDYNVDKLHTDSQSCRIMFKGNAVRNIDGSFVAYQRVSSAHSVVGVSLDVSDDEVAHTSDTFRMIGVNFDFWPSSKDKWKKSGALEIDLSNPQLATLARALNGSLLRMGGSPADMLLYDTYPGACSKENMNKTQKHGSGYYCPIWDQVKGQCLTMERWKELNLFASKTGLHIAFDLNACWGRHSPSGEMDFTMIEGLIRETAKANDDWARVFAFEFGNELYSNIAALRYASDLKHIKNLIKKYWGSRSKAVPKLLGPDCGAGYLSNHYLDTMLSAAEGNKTLHGVTVHLYGENGQCRRHLVVPGFVLNVTCMDSLVNGIIQTYKKTTNNHGVFLWIGEAALQGSSGKSGLTNVFTSTFWYVNTMASFAQAGIGLLSRQALVGGDYELIDKVTMKPNPDYWALLLWYRLSGVSAVRSEWLTCGVECSKCLRAYSRKSLYRRKLTIVINFCIQEAFTIKITRNKGAGNLVRHYGNYVNIYQLTGLPSSRVIKLNNKELIYDGSDKLPDLAPYIFPANSNVDIPEHSITFVDF